MDYHILLGIWFMYAVPASVLSAPIVFFGRKRVHWHFWELSVLVLPLQVWLLLLFSQAVPISKTLSNLGEPFYFSFAVPVAALVRVATGARVAERVLAVCLIAALCGVAAIVFLVVPPMPE
jgi:hypothetical protein